MFILREGGRGEKEREGEREREREHKPGGKERDVQNLKQAPAPNCAEPNAGLNS